MDWQSINLGIFLFLSLAIGGGLLLLSWWLGPKRPLPEKLDPYECGVPLLAPARERFNIKFHLVAIMFLLFDIEVLFLVPWAAVFETLGMVGLIEMGVFAGILVFALVYVLRKGVVDWT